MLLLDVDVDKTALEQVNGSGGIDRKGSRKRQIRHNVQIEKLSPSNCHCVVEVRERGWTLAVVLSNLDSVIDIEVDYLKASL